MALIGKLGVLVAATGAAHFVVPDVFEEITQVAFPKDTKEWVKRNGAAEVAIGAAMALTPTRKFGVLALLGFGGWLGYNAANAASCS